MKITSFHSFLFWMGVFLFDFTISLWFATIFPLSLEPRISYFIILIFGFAIANGLDIAIKAKKIWWGEVTE